MNDWGFDGFKGDYVWSMPECYNPAHNHASPEESTEKQSEIYRVSYEAMVANDPNVFNLLCNCGTPQDYYSLPYMTQIATADPTSVDQTRRRVKAYKALMGDYFPVTADHNNIWYPSAVGTGSVLIEKRDLIQNIKALYEKEWESIIGNCDTLLFLGGGNEPTSLEFVTKLLGKETIDTRTRGQTKGRSGSSSTNFQQTGRELLTMDEVRKLDTKDAILFIRGEDPVLDQKYDLKRHPNIRLTADGKAKPYIHKPQGAPNYALPDLPYTFKSLDDFDFIDMEETEHEESEQEESLEENEDE